MATTHADERPIRSALRQSLPRLLTVVGFGVALLLLSPVAWLLLRTAEIDVDRALSLLTGPTALEVTANTLALVGGVTAGSVLLGVPLALLTVQTDLPFRRFWTVTASLPLVVPSYIGAFAFVSAFGPRGVLADALAPLGVERLPAIYGLHGTVLVLTLFTYPYVYLTTRAALISFDGTLVEAARSLNHSRWRAFRRVTLPQIVPGIAAGALLSALYALSDFGTPAIMRYDVYTRMIYNEFGAHQRDFAALLSLLLVGMALVVLLVESRVSAGRDGAYAARGARRPGTIQLGRWRWPAVGFCVLVAVVCLALPLAILLMWLVRSGTGYEAGGFAFQLSYAWNSVSLAAIAALASVAVAIPVAYLAARTRGGWSSLPERSTYVGYAVPGVVLGLSLVYFGLAYVPFLYQSIVLLVFAYVVRFVPQAVGTTKSSILQVNSRYVEAARSLGHGKLSAFGRVVLPLVAPGVVAGGALVFLTTMKELPATLMLRPTGFETFVTYIWLVQDAGYYGQAAVPALVLVGLSALSMLVILKRERFDVRE